MNVPYEENVVITKKDALIIVDVQNDFIPGGALAVEGGNLIIPGINRVSQQFNENGGIVVLTQDWHPKSHLSFASNHPDKEPGDRYQTGAIGPVLWPDHCVQGTQGAEFHKDLNTNVVKAIIRKGMNPDIDSYSAFKENDRKTDTGLTGYLNTLKINRVFVCGLALDYCCFYTAVDGRKAGFEVVFLLDLTKGIDIPENNVENSINFMIDTKKINFAKL